MQHASLSDYLLTLNNDLSSEVLNNKRLLAKFTYHANLQPNPYILAWQQLDYKTNPSHPEQLIVRSELGIKFRSKSEAAIAVMLHNYSIPFRYEAELELKEYTLYPDFTILHPVTEKIVYWEHFGLMDDPHYRDNCFSKLRTYSNNDIMPSKNLITTFEYKSKPLDYIQIEQIIKDYFVECTL